MNIRVLSPRVLLGGAVPGVVYNFPSAELMDDGSVYVCARRIRSMTDPKGTFEAVRYDPVSGEIRPAPTPAEFDMARHPEYGFYTCHVTRVAPGKLIAIYTVVPDCDESRPMFSPEDDGMQPILCRITRSEDGGESWSEPEDLDYQIPDVIVPSRIQVLKDGTVGFPIEVQHRYGEPYREPVQGRFVYSVDGGKTFDRAAIVPHPRDFLAGDARCTFDGSDDLIIFYWGFDLASTQDLAVYRTRSRDFGRTFEPVEPIDLKKQISSPLWIDENNFLCMYQERFSDRPGIKLMLSHDGGWHYDPESLRELAIYRDSPDTENPFSGFSQYRFGYSTLTRLSPDSALAVYWSRDERDRFSINCQLIEFG